MFGASADRKTLRVFLNQLIIIIGGQGLLLGLVYQNESIIQFRQRRIKKKEHLRTKGYINPKTAVGYTTTPQGYHRERMESETFICIGGFIIYECSE